MVCSHNRSSISSSDNGIQVKDLMVSIDGRTILSNINFELDAGQILTIIGPNGAGKTTLLRSIAGDFAKGFASDENNIVIFGKVRKQWRRRALACQLAVLPQTSVLNFPFTVREVVAMARLPHQTGIEADSQLCERAMTAMAVNSLADRIYTRLSGGEKQRVQLARVLAQVLSLDDDLPGVLLLDEPCAGLDLQYQQRLAEVLRNLSRQGLCVLLSAHDLNWAASISDNMLALKDGKMLTLDSVDAVLKPSLLQQLFSVAMSVQPDARSGRIRVFLP